MENGNQRMVEDLQSENKKILVQFSADWCSPCRILTPHLEKMENDYPNVHFIKVNVGEHRDYASELGITSIPTVIVYDGNKIVSRSSGVNSNDYYKNLLNELQ